MTLNTQKNYPLLSDNLKNNYNRKYLLGKTIIEIFRKDGNLIWHLNGTSDINLIPESNPRFFYEDRLGCQIEFEWMGMVKCLKRV
jgi:hypothetical protein